ncbi:hypothetical protein ACGFOU_36080 [Streptomyces sp. NPDC048595]|uniref:hypothetical protein n=1 Tax=Streptomyces sp. NPDC048595 TaxID=3365576 RepID=UPI00370F77EA
MHKLAIRRIGTAVVAGAAAVAVLTPAAHAAVTPAATPAAALQAEQVKAKKLTVKAYVAYLKKDTTAGGRKTLTQFSRLPKAKQVKFVSYLQDRKVYRAMAAQTKGMVGQNLKVVTPYNKDVKFAKTVTTVRNKDRHATTTVTFTVTEKIFNIPVTSEEVAVRYQAHPGKSPAAARGTAEVKNLNAAITIRQGKTEARKTQGGYTAATRWTAIPNYTPIGAKVVKDQRITAGQGYFKASLTNR